MRDWAFQTGDTFEVEGDARIVIKVEPYLGDVLVTTINPETNVQFPSVLANYYRRTGINFKHPKDAKKGLTREQLNAAAAHYLLNDCGTSLFGRGYEIPGNLEEATKFCVAVYEGVLDAARQLEESK